MKKPFRIIPSNDGWASETTIKIKREKKQRGTIKTNNYMKAEIFAGLPIYEQNLFVKTIDKDTRLAKDKDKAKKILKNVLHVFSISEDQLKSKNRHQKIVLARQFYCYFLRKHTILSSIAIGESIERDHATVLHSVSKIEDTLNYKDILYYHDLIMEQMAKN